MSQLKKPIHVKVLRSESLADIDRKNIISLCNRAYEEDLEPLFNTFFDATHVLGYLDGFLVSHAMWVTRNLQVGTNPPLRTVYVEMVAMEQTYRNRGFATAILKRLGDEINV